MVEFHFTGAHLCGHSARLSAVIAALSSKIPGALTLLRSSGSFSKDGLAWFYSKWPQSQEGLQLCTLSHSRQCHSWEQPLQFQPPR